jgi:hypothetical protein
VIPEIVERHLVKKENVLTPAQNYILEKKDGVNMINIRMVIPKWTVPDVDVSKTA